MEAAGHNIVQIIAAPPTGSETTKRIIPLASISALPREGISNPYRVLLILFAVGVLGGLLLSYKFRRA